MSHLSKSEVIDEMVSEGYDYDTAYRLIYGDMEDDSENAEDK